MWPDDGSEYLQVSELKDGGGADGASSSIYQNAASTFSAGDGSLTYDKIKPQVNLVEETIIPCRTADEPDFLPPRRSRR